MTPPISPPSDPKTQADIEAGEQSSYVRRPAQVSQGPVTFPSDTPVRRRLIAQRRL
ncbi:hypothetical protein AB0O08_15840 [Streptomyces anulatus]|uniref:hypothetical protein n=1 Tax=Streptomyces anulatus TaxID=1892 RepID=UPI00343C9A83